VLAEDRAKATQQRTLLMISLTESATNAIRAAISGAATPIEGLRIAVDSGGCAGFKYMMGLVAEPNPSDVVVEAGGVKVFVDKGSVIHLTGTKIDFVIGLESSGFTFDNPQAQSSCACGKSFG
jgi:iron-sulfur cluster assembly protein